MGHCTSHDLKNHFNERRSDLNPNKILQVSMDGPSVNLEFHRDVQSNREELELPKHWQLFPTHNSGCIQKGS